ncbi:hypothetical protein NDI56_03820 [Haloarcula sp. S1CR25-12]|uniref:Uncharacterized protein n=1 Tax=Haloarcula saliterrae TaxID=2950534 RepID=A0ABU2F8D0_9EURY|nr:hypothetical protein [Haloarcula sp. S1CR25-12]MDS0258538.1 hypothetical protein [Haloarcula sp. S1CR25-12]
MSAEKVQERLDDAVELAIVTVTDADLDEVLVKLERAKARIETVQNSRGGA